MNDLYRRIQERPDLRDKVKLIGIGIGNTPFEVDHFKKKYGVPFPLFPDRDRSIHRALGEVRTPYFIGVRINDDGTHEILATKAGRFKEPGKFLALMLGGSGLE